MVPNRATHHNNKEAKFSLDFDPQAYWPKNFFYFECLFAYIMEYLSFVVNFFFSTKLLMALILSAEINADSSIFMLSDIKRGLHKILILRS